MGEQKISCTVESCKYNKNNEHKCMLRQIIVTPIDKFDTQTAEESMCSSYENENK